MKQVIVFDITLFLWKGSTKLSFSEQAERNESIQLFHSQFPNLLFQCVTFPKSSILLFFLRDILTAVCLVFCWFSPLFLPHIQFVKQFLSLCIHTQCQGPLLHSRYCFHIAECPCSWRSVFFLLFSYHCSIQPSYGSLQLAPVKAEKDLTALNMSILVL